jgi:hypothetical protein
MQNKIIHFIILIAIISISHSALARYIPNYTCPESSEVKMALLTAAHNNSKINIPTRFGLLQGASGSFDVSHLAHFEFDHATFLFGNEKTSTYEVACAYRSPTIILYTYSDYGTPTLYIGASPNWIPDANQMYATCSYSAKYCVFMKKPMGS